MRKDVREFIRRLEAVGLTVESTPGHYRVLREGKPLRKAPQLSSRMCARFWARPTPPRRGPPQVRFGQRLHVRRGGDGFERAELGRDIADASEGGRPEPEPLFSRARLQEIRRMPQCIADVFARRPPVPSRKPTCPVTEELADLFT